jgi:hypothetical protein
MSVAQVDRTDRAFRPGDRPLARRLLAAPVALAYLNNLLRHDHQTIRALTRRTEASRRPPPNDSLRNTARIAADVRT